MHKERIIIEVPSHLKRVFSSILAEKDKTKTEVLRKFIEKYVVRYGK